jgi:hypothetical protein
MQYFLPCYEYRLIAVMVEAVSIFETSANVFQFTHGATYLKVSTGFLGGRLMSVSRWSFVYLKTFFVLLIGWWRGYISPSCPTEVLVTAWPSTTCRFLVLCFVLFINLQVSCFVLRHYVFFDDESYWRMWWVLSLYALFCTCLIRQIRWPAVIVTDCKVNCHDFVGLTALCKRFLQIAPKSGSLVSWGKFSCR